MLRKKLLLAHLALFCLFALLVFPLVDQGVKFVLRHSLEKEADELVAELKTTPDLVKRVKADDALLFYRITLVNERGEVLYDTGNQNEQEMPSVKEALEKGYGFSQSYSIPFQQTFEYVAVLFDTAEGRFVLRIGYPYQEIRAIVRGFQVSLLLVSALFLALYSFLTFGLAHRLTAPIQKIVSAIKSYQEGSPLPKLPITTDEFGPLAETLNHLSARVEKQIEELTQVLASLEEGVIAVDNEGRITYANQSALRFLDTRLETLQRSSFSSSPLHKLAANVLQNSPKKELYRKGLELCLELRSHPLVDRGTLLTMQDKTADYKVIELGKEFISNASHELRTPITIIRGFAETLQDAVHLPREELVALLQKIVVTSIRLESIVKSLLILSDLENLALQAHQMVDLHAIALHAKEMMVVAHPQAKIEVFGQKEEIIGDPYLLELALSNLLANAIKYSERSGNWNSKSRFAPHF
jgi:signal transduction histidine kinase